MNPNNTAGVPVQPTPLAEQVRQAQAEVASWSPEKRDSVQLEGSAGVEPSGKPQQENDIG